MFKNAYSVEGYVKHFSGLNFGIHWTRYEIGCGDFCKYYTN